MRKRFDLRPNPAALFARPREIPQDIAYCEEPSSHPQRAAMVTRRYQQIILEFIELCYRRARMLSGDAAIELLREAGQRVGRIQFNATRDIELRARQLMREAETTPVDETGLLTEAEAHLRELLAKAGDQASLVLINWLPRLAKSP
jgi:hypothetical protein